MFDFDNDGRKDLFTANGDVNDNTEQYSSRASRQRCLLLRNMGATFVSTAALRVYRSSSVTMLIFFMVRDDRAPAGWQSGLFTADGIVKPAYAAFRSPLVQVARAGGRVALWGQIRPRSGRQPFRVRLEEDDGATWLGSSRWTDEKGFFSITVTAPAGAHLRVWSPRDDAYGHEILVR